MTRRMKVSIGEIKIGSVIWWTGPTDTPGYDHYKGFYKVEKVMFDKILLTDSSGNSYTAYEREVTEWP